ARARDRGAQAVIAAPLADRSRVQIGTIGEVPHSSAAGGAFSSELGETQNRLQLALETPLRCLAAAWRMGKSASIIAVVRVTRRRTSVSSSRDCFACMSSMR